MVNAEIDRLEVLKVWRNTLPKLFLARKDAKHPSLALLSKYVPGTVPCVRIHRLSSACKHKIYTSRIQTTAITKLRDCLDDMAQRLSKDR